MKDKISYKVLLHEKQYLKVIAANIVSRFGDSVDAIAFGWLVYTLTGSKEWLVVILAINQIPTILFQPFTGALMNKLNKKRLLVFCDISRGLIVFLIGLLFILHCINPWSLMLLSFLNFTIGSVRMPCGLSIIPKILKKEHYGFAMSTNQSMSRISELIGLGSSGLLIALCGAGGAVLIDGCSFILSGAILILLKVPGDDEQTKNSYFTELKEGFAYFRQNDVIICITVLCFFISMADVPWENLKSAFIKESLHLSVNALSVGSICMSIGLFAGMFAYPYITKKIKNKTVFILSGIIIGILFFFLVLSSGISFVPARLCAYGLTSFLYGTTSAAIDLALVVSLTCTVEPEFMGRAGGIFNAFASASSPVCAFILALAVPVFSINVIYLATGGITLLIFLTAQMCKAVQKIDI